MLEAQFQKFPQNNGIDPNKPQRGRPPTYKHWNNSILSQLPRQIKELPMYQRGIDTFILQFKKRNSTALEFHEMLQGAGLYPDLPYIPSVYRNQRK